MKEPKMLRKITIASILCLCVGSASAQVISGGSSNSLVIGSTPLVGGTLNDCLIVGAGSVLSQSSCGSGGSLAIGGTITSATAGYGLYVGTGGNAGLLEQFAYGTNVFSSIGNPLNGASGLVGYSGQLGTPTQGVLTNATGLPVNTGISGLGANVATALASALNGSGAISATTSPLFTVPEIAGSSTGYTTLASANASATNYIVTIPAATDTVALIATAQTLTNKTLSGASNTLSNIGNASLTNSATTVNGQTCTLGSTCTVAAAAGTLTGSTLASGVTASSLTSVGTIGTGVWQGSNIALGFGGTNASLTASNGGIVYSTASALAILSGTATAGQCLLSGSNTTPSWGSCSGGAVVSSVSNSDGTLTISPTTGSVVASLALGHANTWTATQTLNGSGAQVALGANSGNLGELQFNGSTSGSVTIEPQAVAGSSIVLTLPSTTGTIADAATSPLALSATTGTLTCSTCVTSSGGGAITGTSPVAVSAAGAVSITGAAGQVLAGAGPAFTATPTLGVAGLTVGSVGFANATSGSITLAPTTGALGAVTATLPANTGTLAELNLAQTWTATQTFPANSLTLSELATQTANTVLVNATSGAASPTAVAMPSCSTAASALQWTTSGGSSAVTCNTSITAAAVPLSGITGLGTNVATALGVAAGSGNAGSIAINGLAPGTGTDNTSFGVQALTSNTTGSENAAIGVQALFSNTTGSSNTAMGTQTLFYNTTGSYNIGLGNATLFNNTTGGDNTANGNETLFNNTTGNNNTAIGFEALFSNTTGNSNTGIGLSALRYNTTGSSNTANGNDALYDIGTAQTGGSFVVGISYTIVTIGTTDFTLIGASSNTVGVVFTATGVGSGTGTATPNGTNSNTAIGENTGRGIITGSNNTIIGASVSGLSASLSDVIILATGEGTIRADFGMTHAGIWTVASTTLLATSSSLTNGAGSSAGTLTNAPSIGNPTKWVPINDNGTTRYIPAW